MADLLYFEDIEVGEVMIGATVTASRDQMLSMAQQFDDQPMHMDKEAAMAIGLPDMIASGAYVFALNHKSLLALWRKMHFLPSGRGIEVNFLKPIFPDDVLITKTNILGKRASSKPGRGWLDVQNDLVNQKDEIVADISAAWLIKSRG